MSSSFETIPFPRMISANGPQHRFRKPVRCAPRTVKLRFNRIIFVVLEGHFDAKGTILKIDRRILGSTEPSSTMKSVKGESCDLARCCS